MASESDGSDPLADVEQARAALADRARTPRWYLPLVGLLVAQHILAQGATDLGWTLPSGLLLVGGCALLWVLWRRTSGVTLWPAAGWRSLVALGTWSLAVGVCVWAAAASREDPTVVVAAVVALVASVGLGRLWAAALRDDLVRSDPWAA